MAERWAVICGLVRDESAFVKKLDTLTAWRRTGAIDGIVFSTWMGELDRYPAVAAAYAAGAFTLVETEQPQLKAPGHFIHQMKSLYYGLQAVPSDAWVLRLRPDLAPLNNTIRDTILNAELLSHSTPDWPHVFSSKILIHSAFVDLPFYINDIIFYGRRSDIQKLACFNLSTEYLCINTAPEQFFFRGPFLEKFPIIDAFMQVMPQFTYGNEPASVRRRDVLLESDFFLEVLASNVLFLKKYFRVGFVPEDRRGQKEKKQFSIAEIFSATRSVPGVSYHNGAHAALFEDERALDAIISREFVRDQLGERFAAALDRVSEASYRNGFVANPLTPHPSVRSLAEAIQHALPGMSHRLDERQDEQRRHFVVRGHRDRMQIAGGTDETRRLEEEVNALRRRVDALNEAKKT